jgi:hypothetical protein
MNRCVKAAEDTGAVSFGVFAFDISWNDDSEKFNRDVFKIPPKLYWQIHIYGFIRTDDYQAVETALKALSPEDEKIRTPLLSNKLLKTAKRNLSYLFKPTAFKRRKFWAIGKKRSSWQTGKDKALSTSAHVEYLQAAHQLGIARRIALLNLHPVSGKSKPGKLSTISLRIVAPRRSKM